MALSAASISGLLALALAGAMPEPGVPDTADRHVVAVIGSWALPGQEYDGYVCTGVSIAPHVVLTAAHCVDDRRAEDLAVSAFDVDLCDAARVTERRAVKGVTVHPGFDPATNADDLAVLRVEGSAVEGSATEVLPVVAARAGDPGVVSGFGPPSAGAGFVRDERRRVTLAGLVSWGVGCGDARHPGVYVDPAAYGGWLAAAESLPAHREARCCPAPTSPTPFGLVAD